MMRSRAYVFLYQGDTAVNKMFIFIPVTMTYAYSRRHFECSPLIVQDLVMDV